MNKKLYLLLISLPWLTACQTVVEDINQFQSDLQGGLGIHTNVKEIHGIRFDAKSCELTEFRTINCRLVVTSKFQDRTLNLLGGGYTKVQDDTGKSYPTRISFGESAEGGQKQSVLIADTPYNVTLTAENISSQATKVRAIDIARMDIANASGQFTGYVKLVLSSPPAPTAAGTAGRATPAAASQESTTPASEPASTQSAKEFRGVRFDAQSCELTESRSIICRLVVTSKFQDRQLTIYGSAYTEIQDDTGKSYPTRMSFGESVEGGQKHSVLIADTPYKVTLTADNVSSQATKARAINIGRMDLANQSGQFTASVKLVLAHPPMIGSQNSMNVAAEADTMPTGTQHPTQNTPAKPVATTPKTQKPQTPTSASGTERTATAAWQTVGLWDYDATDAQHLAKGFVLREKQGAGAGQTWQAHLELKNHNALTPRQRNLWPVMMSISSRKVCANYPGYPTYPVFVDMPGKDNDGIYLVSYCEGGVSG